MSSKDGEQARVIPEWSEAELHDLVEGVLSHRFNWERILDDRRFKNFHKDRQADDLRLKYYEIDRESQTVDASTAVVVGTKAAVAETLYDVGPVPITPVRRGNGRKKAGTGATPRVAWTQPEIAALMAGVSKYGYQWERILSEARDQFQPQRNGTSLKDKWRNIQKARERQGTPAPAILQVVSPGHNRKKRTPFSEEEELALMQGVEKHGRCWTKMIADEDLGCKFHSCRRPGDLKDKWRNMVKKGRGLSTPAKLLNDQIATSSTRKRTRLWTEAEKDAVVAGYAKHKNHKQVWKKILEDEEFRNIFHEERSNVGLKDCYRNMNKKKRLADQDAEDMEETNM